MKLYLSGPISGVPDGNQAHFNEAECRLSPFFSVVNPKNLSACSDRSCAPQDARYPGDHSWECWLRYDLKAMLDCDAVAMLAGWQSSKGAALEVEVARRVGMKTRSWWVWYGSQQIGIGNIQTEFLRHPVLSKWDIPPLS